MTQLTYSFEYRYRDGRDPETYVEPLRRAIATWQANREVGYRSLRYRRGPDFLVVRDRRPNVEPADYTLSESEARIYLACEDGASVAEVCETLPAATQTEVSADDVRAFLDELVASRLMHHEEGVLQAPTGREPLDPAPTWEDLRASSRESRFRRFCR